MGKNLEYFVPFLLCSDMTDDIHCGKNASALTCLVRHRDNAHLSERGVSDFQVSNLRELIDVIEGINRGE